jgi:epoxyqueuosine reductase
MEYREAVGVRVYGCDTCLDACPVGRRSASLHEEAVSSVSVIRTLLALPDESLLAAYPHFYVPERRASHLRRNVLLAAGNLEMWDEEVAAGLRRYATSPEPVLAEQARWSLARYEQLDRSRALVN